MSSDSKILDLLECKSTAPVTTDGSTDSSGQTASLAIVVTFDTSMQLTVQRICENLSKMSG